MATDMDIEMDLDVGLMDEDLEIDIVPEVDKTVSLFYVSLGVRSL